MFIPVICLLLITFVIGFVTGKRYVIKGLALRAEQLYEEYDYRKAEWLESLLKEDD